MLFTSVTLLFIKLPNLYFLLCKNGRTVSNKQYGDEKG